MINVMEKSSGKVIGLQVDGKLAHADYQKFVPMLERIIQEHGSVRCCMELTNFHGITPHALWDEMKFDIKHCKDVDRCAIVGDKTSHKWMAKLGGLIFRKADIRYFDASEADKAWSWVSESTEPSCGCSAGAKEGQSQKAGSA